MTPEQTLAAAKLMQEWAQSVIDGKPIEVEYQTDQAWIRCFLNPIWDWANYDYRLKPQPKRVPLEAKDVPPGSVFKLKDWGPGEHRQYFQVVKGGIFWTNEQQFTFTWNELLDQDWQISRDNGKTWEGCWKEQV